MKTKQLIPILISTCVAQWSWADLLNIDFGADIRFPSLNKTGFAATGITANDYWNFYSADNPDGSWRVNGSLLNLKYASGQTSSAGLNVNFGDGAWSYGQATTDPMLYNYIYSLSGGALQTILSVSDLAPGRYNFYLYGPDATFNLKVGTRDYGTQAVLDVPNSYPPPWVEGKQYVRFSNVDVGVSESAVISLGAGQTYIQGLVSGMQIELVPEPSATMLLGLGGLLMACTRKARK